MTTDNAATMHVRLLSAHEVHARLVELAEFSWQIFSEPPWSFTAPIGSPEKPDSVLGLFHMLQRHAGDFVVATLQGIVGVGVGVTLDGETLAEFDLARFGAHIGDYYMASVAVAREWRDTRLPELSGKSVVHQLRDIRFALARMRGTNRVWVRTGVNVDKVIRLYKKLEFTEVGRAMVTQGGTCSERVVMCGKLPPPDTSM